jgi:predicted enzyme related to lactoylglutathione lyase
MPNFELGLLDRNHETVSQDVGEASSGVMLTFVVKDVEEVHSQAKQADATVLEPARDMPYGQRRMLLRDPTATLVDVSSPTAGQQ